jgi:putative copper export protein
VDAWTLVRFLHVIAVAFFVGGQLMLVVAVVPALRGRDDRAPMRVAARRFAAGSVVALAVLVATGVAMASRLHLWQDDVLQLKLVVLVLVVVLAALHAVSPGSRTVQIAVFLCSLALVWLGVQLTHGTA